MYEKITCEIICLSELEGLQEAKKEANNRNLEYTGRSGNLPWKEDATEEEEVEEEKSH